MTTAVAHLALCGKGLLATSGTWALLLEEAGALLTVANRSVIGEQRSDVAIGTGQ